DRKEKNEFVLTFCTSTPARLVSYSPRRIRPSADRLTVIGISFKRPIERRSAFARFGATRRLKEESAAAIVEGVQRLHLLVQAEAELKPSDQRSAFYDSFSSYELRA